MVHMGPGGVLAWFLGAVLWELVSGGPWEGTELERLQQLWIQIVFVYDQLGSTSRLSLLPLTQFYHGADNWTCFTGKCADATELLYVLREVCEEFNTMSPRDLHRLECFKHVFHI